MKSKLASALLALILGCSVTLLFAEDDKTGTSSDSSTSTSAPDESTDTAAGTATPDETVSSKPEEEQK